MIDIGQEAEYRLQKFVSTIHNLIVSRDIHFDLLVCGGNTGLVMAYITERVYAHIGITPPAKLVLPIYRYYPGFLDDPEHLFDNSHLQSYVESALDKLSSLHNVLFVDDEIGLGITASTILGFLYGWQQSHHSHKGFNYYIVAEDQGFKVENRLSGVNINFVPYAYEIEGWNNIIACIVPAKYENPVVQIFPEHILPFHQRMNILLDLPIKEFANGQPRFSSGFLEKAKEAMPNLSLLQKEFRSFLDEKIGACCKSLMVEHQSN